MNTFTTNTNIVPIVDVSLYNGAFSFENLWDTKEKAREGLIVCEDYDTNKVKKAITISANRVFEELKPLKEFGVSKIEATKFRSPWDYYYGNDMLELKVVVDDYFFGKALERISYSQKKAKEYVERHWKTRPGFLSFMPITEFDACKLTDIIEGLKTGASDNEIIDFGTVLCLLYVATGKESLTNEVLHDFLGANDLEDFCTIVSEEKITEEFPIYSKINSKLHERLSNMKRVVKKYLLSGVPDSAKQDAQEYFEIESAKIERLSEELYDILCLYPDKERVDKDLEQFYEDLG